MQKRNWHKGMAAALTAVMIASSGAPAMSVRAMETQEEAVEIEEAQEAEVLQEEIAEEAEVLQEDVTEEVEVIVPEEDIISYESLDATNFSSAQALVSGSRVSMTFTKSGTSGERVCSFMLSQSGYVSFQLDHALVTSSSACWGIDLYNAAQEKITTTYGYESASLQYAGDKSPVKSANIGLAAGKYYAVVKSYSAGLNTSVGLTYRFTAASDWEKEPNNSSANANPISLGRWYNGACYKGDTDYYQFELTKKGYITIDFQNGNSTDFIIEVERISSNDTIARWSNEYTTVMSGTSFTTSPMGLNAGTYVVWVENTKNTTDYALRVNFNEASNYEVEPNNQKSDANIIPVDTYIYGGASPYHPTRTLDTVDWYAFSVSQDTEISIGFKYQSGVSTSDVVIHLYDNNQSSLLGGFWGLNTSEKYVKNVGLTTDKVQIKKGQLYYIQLAFGDKSYNQNVTDTYRLIINTGSNASSSGGGWQKDSKGWWYRNADGSYPKSAWKQIGGKWYHFDASGYMQTGWLKDGGKWYYLKSSGEMAIGWVKVGSKWYYMNASGAMQTGWVKVGSTWYYLNSSGAMQTGWLKSGGKWYYLKSSGAMATGWTKVGNQWYYMNSSGAMQTGWIKLSGKWYYLDASGAMLANTSRYIGGKTYRFNASGVCTNP